MPVDFRDVPTPAYVYDLDEVRRAHHLLHSFLPPGVRLYYSLKANPHPAIVRTLVMLGCGTEVCSPGELCTAAAAATPVDQILYAGPGKRDVDVADAVRAGVRWFSADSPYGLMQIEKAAITENAEVRCLLRVNPRDHTAGPGLTMTGVASQFGADADWVVAEPAEFRQRLAGFQVYLGSNIADTDALLDQFKLAVETVQELADIIGFAPELVDLGGGFGAPFARSGNLPVFPTLADQLADLFDAAFPGWREQHPVIAFESGRYLAGTCGALLMEVLDVKQSQGRRVIVLESGINHLGGMSGLRRVLPIVPDILPAPSAGMSGTLRETIVAGPLCTPLDTWAPFAQLPEIRAGDVVRVPNVGAYGLTASLLAFLGYPAPYEVIVDNGRCVDVTQLEIVRRAHVDGGDTS